MKITKSETYTIEDIDIDSIKLLSQGLYEILNKDEYNPDASHKMSALIQTFDEIIG